MLLEMHCHTSEHSACSFVPAAALIRQLHERDLHGAIITDHHYLWKQEDLDALKTAAHVPQFFVLISGQEVSTADVGDVLVYGATAAIRKGTPLRDIRAHYPDSALVLAHPYRDGRLPSPETLLDPLLDAIEIFSSNHSVSENARALRDWHRYKFTAIAGTDTHGLTYAGLYPTYLEHPVETVQELVEEVRKGRCRPFFRETPRAKARVHMHEVAMGKNSAAEPSHSIIIKRFLDTDLWQSAQRANYIVEELRHHGFAEGTFRVPTIIEDDTNDMTLVEESVPGTSLFEKLTTSPIEDGKSYVRLAARWLAHLHNQRLQITPPSEFLPREQDHLIRYGEHFTEVGHPHAGRAEEIIEAVRSAEKVLFDGHPDRLVQGHGDYHPKNIFLGRDDPKNVNTTFVVAIDFDSSYCLPPAFDAGTFLAQFRNQLIDYPDILKGIPEEVFLDAYLAGASMVDADFINQVELFRARTDLGIASFLIQIGLGGNENLWRVLVEAEKALTQFRLGENYVSAGERRA